MEKLFVKPFELYRDSVKLGYRILESGYKPDGIIGILRGGAVPCLVIHELFKLNGLEIPFDMITAKSYNGKEQAEVKLRGLSEVEAFDKKLLLVDDLWDTGNTLNRIISVLNSMGAKEIRTATLYYKPTKNLQIIKPDYYLRETSEWVVFPHELSDILLDGDKHPLYNCIKIKSGPGGI